MENKINEKLNKDLELITFTPDKQNRVLNRVKHPTLKEKIQDFLNQEITIPLIPVTTICSLLFVAFWFRSHEIYQNQGPFMTPLKTTKIVEKGGNLYWQEWFVEVKERESQTKG